MERNLNHFNLDYNGRTTIWSLEVLFPRIKNACVVDRKDITRM